jgi:hypothetical protein
LPQKRLLGNRASGICFLGNLKRYGEEKRVRASLPTTPAFDVSCTRRLLGRRRVNREIVTFGVVSTIVAVLVAILSVVLPPVIPEQLSSLPIVVVVLLAVAAVLFLFVVPRAARSDHPAVAGLICGIVGLLLVLPAFWSGLPIVLGAAGALLGRMGRTTGRGLALAAIVTGTVAVVLDLLALLLDRLLS